MATQWADIRKIFTGQDTSRLRSPPGYFQSTMRLIIITGLSGSGKSVALKALEDGGYYTTEYTAGLDSGSHPWEESRGMGFSYGYNRAESIADYRPDREMILMLADLASRGGNLLLDIGPTGDGRIPVIMQERLLQIGRWLGTNGEAIYGTRPAARSRQWSEGAQPKLETGEYMTRYEIMDFVEPKKPGQAIIETFFTAKGGDIYAIVPRWPGAALTIRGASAPSSMRPVLLGREGALKWMAKGGDVVVAMPEAPGDSTRASHAYTIKLPGLSLK